MLRLLKSTILFVCIGLTLSGCASKQTESFKRMKLDYYQTYVEIVEPIDPITVLYPMETSEAYEYLKNYMADENTLNKVKHFHQVGDNIVAFADEHVPESYNGYLTENIINQDQISLFVELDQSIADTQEGTELSFDTCFWDVVSRGPGALSVYKKNVQLLEENLAIDESDSTDLE